MYIVEFFKTHIWTNRAPLYNTDYVKRLYDTYLKILLTAWKWWIFDTYKVIHAECFFSVAAVYLYTFKAYLLLKLVAGWRHILNPRALWAWSHRKRVGSRAMIQVKRAASIDDTTGLSNPKILFRQNQVSYVLWHWTPEIGSGIMHPCIHRQGFASCKRIWLLCTTQY